jgi:hypothetical protein
MTVKKIGMIFGVAVGFAVASASAVARPDVNVSVQINQPGVYGRIDIGRVPAPPVLLYPQPVLMVPGQVVVRQASPIYLHVPPGHSKHWGKHCHRYNACGQQVYFVRNDWYQRHYYPEHRRDWEHEHRGEGPRDEWRDAREQGGHRGEHGNGRGNGHDRGRHDD